MRRIGGLILALAGAALLAGPTRLALQGAHSGDPKLVSDVAYLGTLGLFLLIVGLYFLTRRPKKGPEKS